MLLHDIVMAACHEIGAETYLLHMHSTLGRMHGRIKAYDEGGHKHTLSAASYTIHMKEAKQWRQAFRPSYLKGTMPTAFQGSLQPPSTETPSVNEVFRLPCI
jgi:hypothetical protein